MRYQNIILKKNNRNGPLHWRIRGVLPVNPPPTGSISFVFTEKCTHWRLALPPWVSTPPPMGNPGSATALDLDMEINTGHAEDMASLKHSDYIITFFSILLFHLIGMLFFINACYLRCTRGYRSARLEAKSCFPCKKRSCKIRNAVASNILVLYQGSDGPAVGLVS